VVLKLSIEAVGFGVVTAVLFGTADFIAKLSADRVGYLRTTLYMQSIGGLFVLLFSIQRLQLFLQYPYAAAMAVGLGAINVVATISLYKSFEIGNLSVVSPLASGYPAITALLAILLLGESQSGWHLSGIGLTFFGVFAVSLKHRKDSRLQKTTVLAAGTVLALLAATLYGILFFGFKFVVEFLGPWLPVLVLRGVSVAGAGTALGLVKPNRSASVRKFFYLFIALGVLDTLATVTYLTGITSGEVSTVSSVSSLFSVITVLLAILFLKEKPMRRQSAGILAILLGVFVLGYF
jgi:drug/metabolite transporter (DMT)-like permease